ncbi:hypothetical protein Tco_0341604 [Tanacetum coccineum]
MIPKIERLSRVNELQGFPYGLKHVAAPFWLLLSSENRPWILGYGVLAESVLFLIFDKSIIYGVSADVDTAYSSKSGNEPGDGITCYTRRHHNSSGDGVTSFLTASASTDSNADLEDSSYDGVMTKMRRRQDLGSIIDSGLSEVVLGKPFAQASKLTYDESLGLIRFAQKDNEVVFRMPQRTKELDLVIFDEEKLGSS